MKDETAESISVAIIAFISITFSSAITHYSTDRSWRRQIAGHHAAEFFIDKNNYQQWRWIDCHPSPVSEPNDSNTVSP